MLTIEITESVATYDYLADMLRRIADLIDEGYTRGYGPDWSTEGTEDPTDFNDEGGEES